MKFSVEIDLYDLFDCANDVDEEFLGDALKDEIVSQIKEKIAAQTVDDVVKRVDDAIAKKIAESEKAIQEAVDKFINDTCSGKLETLKIAKKKSNWGNDIEYMPIMEYIGERFESYLSQKRFDENGRVPNWDSEKKYSAMDFLVRGYFSKKLDEKISEMIKKAQKDSEQMVFDLIETRLKENFAADTISRMNIPGILRQLQEQASNVIEAADENKGGMPYQ